MTSPAWLTPAVRKWIYGIALAVLPLLIAYGVLSAEQAPLWIALVGAILVPGLAVTHTDTSTSSGMPAAEYNPTHD